MSLKGTRSISSSDSPGETHTAHHLRHDSGDGGDSTSTTSSPYTNIVNAIDEALMQELARLTQQMEFRHKLILSKEDLQLNQPEAPLPLSSAPSLGAPFVAKSTSSGVLAPTIGLQSISSTLHQPSLAGHVGIKPLSSTLSALQSSAQSMQIFPSSIAESTVIISKERSHVAKAVLNALVETGKLPLSRSASFVMRANFPFNSTELTWGDLKEDAPSTKSRLGLYALLKAGVGFIDLKKARLVQTFEDLRRDFGFNPVDLTVNYELFNMSMLHSFFGVTYATLAVEFSVGLIDYLLRLNLSMADIASAGIDIETMLNWSDRIRDAFNDNHMPNPLNSRSMSHKELRLFTGLTADMFVERVKKRGDAPTDWSVFMGMRGEHLLRLGLTRAQIASMWKEDYGSVAQILTEVFQCTPDEINSIPSGVDPQQPGKKVKVHEPTPQPKQPSSSSNSTKTKTNRR